MLGRFAWDLNSILEKKLTLVMGIQDLNYNFIMLIENEII